MRTLCIGVMALAMGVSTTVAAQSSRGPQPQTDEKGFISYAEFQGSANSEIEVMKLDTTVGYNFNRHFGADFGVPIYFARSSSTSSSGSSSNTGLGDAYLSLRFKTGSSAVNFASIFTGYAPTGDTGKGLSTGRATFDWNNHFDHSFSRLTPFAEIGMGNTIVDSRRFTRPFTTLGFNTHFQLGASFDLRHSLSVGAAAYEVLPSGQQKVFSKVSGSAAPGAGSHGRVFETNLQTTGPSDIARDNGFSGWLDVSPSNYLDLELGFNRSIHYDLNTIAFTVGVNVGQLVKKANRH